MIDGVPVVREAFPHTVRLVTTARLRVSVLAELVDGDDLAALAEIEGATSRRLTAETRGIAGLPANELVHGVAHARFINASFAYAKPRALSRFNGPDRGAWYAALEVETSVAEVAYHLTQALADAGDFNAVVDYAEMHASLAGEFLDLRQRPDHQALDPDETRGYAAGNAMANAARAAGLNGVIYPSVRCPSGTCVAALWPHAVQSVAQGKVWRLTWNGKTRAPNLKSRPSLNIETYSPAYRGVSTFDHFIFFERPQAPGGEDRFRASFYVNTREPRN